MKVRLRPAARDELIATVRWYALEAGAATARSFEQAVVNALALLSSQPAIGTPGVAGTRRWPVKNFPYMLVYRVRSDELTIVAVAHQRRRPSYWEGSR